MAHEKNHDYHIIEPSLWPFLASVGAFLLLTGSVLFFHDVTPWVMAAGFAVVLYSMYVWFADMVRESRAGDHTPVVAIGLRMGFILFVISEVMFFVAWFWSFFKHAIFPMDGLWPPEGIVTFNPWELPLINTLILLLSGCTVTYAHHALIEGKRLDLVWGLVGTVALGAIFSIFQAYEYTHAEFGFSGNIYGANFYMATGFHGFHVLVGTLFLAVCLYRAQRGHFTPGKHLGFETAAWYWHFVDVVWLFLFCGIYIWGR
ncbi:MAG: cytochrome c oxidase subunit 3 [Pseudomonadota bacterium]